MAINSTMHSTDTTANSLLSGLPASSVQSLRRMQNCAARLILKKHKTDLCFNFSTGPQPNNEFNTRETLSATYISRALLRLISVTVFNFTHPPVLSVLLLILSASRFLAPDSPLGVPAPFLFSVNLRRMTFPYRSDRNPFWTHSNVS